MVDDPSNGYEAAAARFMAARSRIGVDQVRAWARALPAHATVLDIGCGYGVPVTEALLAEGCRVFAVDASPSMVSAFHGRFPDVPIVCEAAEASSFFGRTYDGIVAWGLMFLLARNAQHHVIASMARALASGGTFLFTAPAQRCTWRDALTGQLSTSLGSRAYGHALGRVGLVVRREFDDDGGNHYYVGEHRRVRQRGSE